MATVYLAHDVRHERKVAIKVMLPDLASSIGVDRFLREVRITASLAHPHILPLLDSGEADGRPFYVMPYVEGGTLRDQLRREKQLTISRAIEIARHVADALAHAHSRGVLHRDIKPENILFQSDHALVADFGIASAIAAAGASEHLTKTGTLLGTPAYMSPEQASGERDLDVRTDVYSLACVTYEMLAGEPPFTGPTSQIVLVRRLTEKARPVSATRQAVPPAVDAAVARALAPVAADRFATAQDFAAALTVPNESTGLSRGRGTVLAAIAAIIVLAVGAYWLSQRPTSSTQGQTSPRLAVLPFENLGSPDDDPFTDGITDEITSRLAEISGLRVVSRTSAKRFKGSNLSMQQLGKDLGADFILEGTVRTDRASGGAGTARVTPQLIRVSDDVHVWQNRFDASLIPGDIFRVQADIARQIATSLRITIGEAEGQRVDKSSTSDSAAYRLDQLGRFHWEKRDAPGLLRAVQYFNAAIERDSNFVDAYAGLAAASASYLIFFAPDSGHAASAPALAAARRAVALDSASAPAYAALGYVLMIAEWKWAAADSAFQRAIALDGEYGPARYWFTQLLWVQGRYDEALEQARLAVAVDPLSAIAHLAQARSLRLLGRIEEAEAALARTAELQPTMYAAYADLAADYARTGRMAEAERAVMQYLINARLPSDSARVREIVQVLAGRGDARRIGHLLDRPGAPTTQAAAARWFAAAGFRDSAFGRLRAAVAVHSYEMYFIPPFLVRSLGDDPRWQPFLESSGFPSLR